MKIIAGKVSQNELKTYVKTLLINIGRNVLWKKILILSPYTDDAELGCGGSIAKFLENECKILWIVFSSTEESLPIRFTKKCLKKELLR